MHKIKKGTENTYDANYDEDNSDASFHIDTPEDYGYSSWEEMELNEAWEGNIDDYNAYYD